MTQSYLDLCAPIGILLVTAFNITPSLPYSFTEFLCSPGWLWILGPLLQPSKCWEYMCSPDLASFLSLEHQCLKCGLVMADGHHSPQWAISVFPLAWSFLVLTLVAYSFLVNYFEILKKYSLIPPFLFNIGDLAYYKLLGWKFYRENFESTGWWYPCLLFSASIGFEWTLESKEENPVCFSRTLDNRINAVSKHKRGLQCHGVLC